MNVNIKIINSWENSNVNNIMNTFARMLLVGQELPTLLKHPSSPPHHPAVFIGVRNAKSSVSVLFCRSLFVLLVIVMSVLLRFTAFWLPIWYLKTFFSIEQQLIKSGRLWPVARQNCPALYIVCHPSQRINATFISTRFNICSSHWR